MSTVQSTGARWLLAAICLFGAQPTLALPITDMGQIGITVYLNDTHSPDPPELVGTGFIRYDRAYVERQVALHQDEFFLTVDFPIIDASFEMFGVTFDESDIQWQQGYDLGQLERLGVFMQNDAGDYFQFGADSEDYSLSFQFLNGYSGQQSGYPCYVSTPDGPWPGSDEESLDCEFDQREVPVTASEPGTLALLTFGLICWSFARTRRRARGPGRAPAQGPVPLLLFRSASARSVVAMPPVRTVQSKPRSLRM
jgi:hypothetical protein